MNVLISGINGFIGGDLFQMLSADEVNVVSGMSRNKTAFSPDNIYAVDLADENSVKSFIKKAKDDNLNIDVFVHCASILADAVNNRSFSLFTDNNLITNNVITIVNELGIKTLINLSTIGVYPNADGEYDERTAIDPSKNFECLYSLSKFCSEQLFNFYLLPKVNVVNLRLSQVYGERMRDDRIYKIMENEMKKDNRISVWSNGERVSNFVGIEYVINTILFFMKHDQSGLFNVGGENLTYKELAEKVIEKNNAQNVEVMLIDKGVKSKVYINSDKLKKVLQ
jgi:nucleoside-diphosphate-sugar epimerase